MLFVPPIIEKCILKLSIRIDPSSSPFSSVQFCFVYMEGLHLLRSVEPASWRTSETCSHFTSKSTWPDAGTRVLWVNVCMVGTFSITLLLILCHFIKGVLRVRSTELGLVFCFSFNRDKLCFWWSRLLTLIVNTEICGLIATILQSVFLLISLIASSCRLFWLRVSLCWLVVKVVSDGFLRCSH